MERALTRIGAVERVVSGHVALYPKGIRIVDMTSPAGPRIFGSVAFYLMVVSMQVVLAIRKHTLKPF